MINAGDMVRIWIDILDEQGAPVSGLPLTVTIMRPDGQSDTLTPTEDAPGHYSALYTIPLPGIYRVRWAAPGIVEWQILTAEM